VKNYCPGWFKILSVAEICAKNVKMNLFTTETHSAEEEVDEVLKRKPASSSLVNMQRGVISAAKNVGKLLPGAGCFRTASDAARQELACESPDVNHRDTPNWRTY